jgi:hypothetical protein
MPEHEVRGSAFYDHELEDEGTTGRRRGPVADWGVNEELFDHMPSRRRFRPSEGAAVHREPVHREPVHREPRAVEAPRRDGHPRERHAEADRRVRTGARLERADRTPDARARMAEDYARFTAELELPESIRRAEPATVADAAWMAELATPVLPQVPDAERAPDPDLGARAAAPDEALAPVAEPQEDAPRDAREPADPTHTAAGRRTVVIRGRGTEPMLPARRERAPRSAVERLGPRPDRLAAYAVVLGVLLILIAILTAHG